MKRLALLWLVILLAAACVEKTEEQPHPTLQRYTPDTPARFGAAVHPAMTATPGGIEVANLPSLTLIGPVCADSPSGAFVCSGWVYNPLEIAYTSVSVNVALMDDAGISINAQTGIIARDWLLPGSGAPYRLIFPAPPQENVTPVVTLVLAEPSETHRILALEVQNIELLPENDQYRVRGEIYNGTDERVAPVRVVITLRDTSGEVAGYREIEIEQLVAGARTSFETFLMPQGTSADQVHVTADGYRR